MFRGEKKLSCCNVCTALQPEKPVYVLSIPLVYARGIFYLPSLPYKACMKKLILAPGILLSVFSITAQDLKYYLPDAEALQGLQTLQYYATGF
jgi:hypothetical protein